MTRRIDPVFGAAWAAALESGDYAQGRCALYKSGGKSAAYCCLGVAAQLLGTNLNEKMAAPSTGGHYKSLLPVISAARQSHFIRLNDYEKRSFAEIASEIRTLLT